MATYKAQYGNPAHYNATPPTRTDGEPSALEVDVNGNLLVNPGALTNTTDSVTSYPATDAIMNGATALTPKFKVIQTTDTGSNEVVAAVAGKKIRVLSYVLVSAGTVTAYFASAATAKTGVMPLVANSGVSSGYCPLGQFETVAAEALNLVKSGDVDVSGHLLYVEV